MYSKYHIHKIVENKDLQSYKNNIELTNIVPSLSNEQLKDFADKVVAMDYKSVCVLSQHVNIIKAYTYNSSVKINISTIIGLPDGKLKQRMKIDEIRTVVNDGVDKINVVIDSDIFKLADSNISVDEKKEGFNSAVSEIRELAKVCHNNGKTIFIIPEFSNLNYDELEIMVDIMKKSTVDGIMTNTGMGKAGVEIDKLKFVRRILPDFIQLQASGGIKNMDSYLEVYKYCDIISTSAFF